LKNGFIEHHLKRTMRREEWYTLTEKGEKILEFIEEIEEIKRSYKVDRHSHWNYSGSRVWWV